MVATAQLRLNECDIFSTCEYFISLQESFMADRKMSNVGNTRIGPKGSQKSGPSASIATKPAKPAPKPASGGKK